MNDAWSGEVLLRTGKTFIVKDVNRIFNIGGCEYRVEFNVRIERTHLRDANGKMRISVPVYQPPEIDPCDQLGAFLFPECQPPTPDTYHPPH